jgi:hypothetical protein
VATSARGARVFADAPRPVNVAAVAAVFGCFIGSSPKQERKNRPRFTTHAGMRYRRLWRAVSDRPGSGSLRRVDGQHRHAVVAWRRETRDADCPATARLGRRALR